MPQRPCPDPEELDALVRCSLPEASAESLLEHLENCPRCEETVCALEGRSTILPDLKKPRIPLPFEDEPNCQKLLSSLLTQKDVSAGTQRQPAPLPKIRDYRLVKLLGAGGMGTVYQAVHERLQRTVALKLLPRDRHEESAVQSRFEREMLALGQLQHANIVTAYDAGIHEGQHYLVMEYVEGQDLAAYVEKQGPLPIAEAVLAVVQTATGLQYASDQGFIHRDIKPSNLMLARSKRPDGKWTASIKILDLGLARAVHAEIPAGADELTAAGQVMGTLDYMAPEQGSDAHDVDARADIYALGATLYKLLTGQTPHAEHSKKPPLQRLMAMAQNEPRGVRTLRPDIPEELAAIIHRMLARRPEDRIQTHSAVVAALKPFCEGARLSRLLAPRLVGANPPIQSPAQSPSTPTRPLTLGQGGPDRPRRRWIVLCAGLAGLALLGVIVSFSTRHGRIEVSTPDGQLPQDVKLVVSQGGDNIGILQAENHWSLRVINGEYQITVEGGQDQIQIDQSSVSVSRLGRALVTVRIRPPEKSVAVGPAPSPPARSSHPDAKTSPVPPRPAMSVSSGQPDRTPPFRRLSATGELAGEHQFINEALSVSQPGDVIEVHGNGPFRLGKIIWNDRSMTVRAAQGYRPRFLATFDIAQDSDHVVWLDLRRVDLTMTGCDLVGPTTGDSTILSGDGGNWHLENCRLIQPSSRNGVGVAFQGGSLTLRDSLIRMPAPTTGCLALGENTQANLERNVLQGAGFAISAIPATGSQLTLIDNIVHQMIPFSIERPRTATGPITINAHNNLFAAVYSEMMLSWNQSEPKDHVVWKGQGNRYLPGREGPLWTWAGRNVMPPAELATVGLWNTFWENPAGLTQISSATHRWDLFDATDVETIRQRFADELTATGNRHPDLTGMGPDMKQIGPGQPGSPTAAPRQSSLEGGPFVHLRDDKEVAGYLDLPAALPNLKEGDVIEVRSDARFGEIVIGHPVRPRLTLRAGQGYRPSFARFYADVSAGDWTLEGLHFRGVEQAPAIMCRARRIAHCSVAPLRNDGRVWLHAPAPPDVFPEVTNCLFANSLVLSAARSIVSQSVLQSVSVNSSVPSRVDVDHSLVWTHRTNAVLPAQSAITADGVCEVNCTNSLLDCQVLQMTADLKWTGDRNLFRVLGSPWSTFQAKSGQWQMLTDLPAWQQHWSTDRFSRQEDSYLLHEEPWSTAGSE